MASIALNEAQERLADLIHGLEPGEVLTITEDDRPVAQLIPVPIETATRRTARPRPPVTGVPKAGGCEGLFVVPDDFKGPLEELRE